MQTDVAVQLSDDDATSKRSSPDQREDQQHREGSPTGMIASRPWHSVLQMVFDAMHNNGVLRHHVPSGQVITHVADHCSIGCNGLGVEGVGNSCHVTSAHMATTTIDDWQEKPLLGHHDEEEGLSPWETKGNNFVGNGRQDPQLNGAVKINLPPPEREEPKFPREKWKTVISFVFVFSNWVLTTVSLAIVHERLPDRATSPPLPDIVFDIFPPQDWALSVSEILIIVSVNMCLLSIFLHKHRLILLRRCFLILGLLYLMRCITMFVTQVPVASTTYYCSPKANSTSPAVVSQRVLQLMSGFGLSINGQHTYCGDYIYSGHTVILTMAYLVIREYTPRRCVLLHWLSWLMSVTGVVMVLLARGHYTVDVIIAYYVTTRVFWMYHTMANNPNLKKSGTYNYLSRLWWFCIFEYFEKNVGGVVPRQYEWPLPWPRRLSKRDRNS